jgi:hypothetical protein
MLVYAHIKTDSCAHQIDIICYFRRAHNPFRQIILGHDELPLLGVGLRICLMRDMEV